MMFNITVCIVGIIIIIFAIIWVIIGHIMDKRKARKELNKLSKIGKM